MNEESGQGAWACAREAAAQAEANEGRGQEPREVDDEDLLGERTEGQGSGEAESTIE